MLDSMRLSAEGARILGSLMEKQLTTPQQYPLTMSSLISSCNQTSNRDPVVDYDEEAVMSALERLKELRLVRFVLPSHGRTVVRFRHVLDETLTLDLRQCALLAVLLLRGPQTVGELRLRTDRMVKFQDLKELEDELRFMASRDEPLVTNTGRRPGQKEERWECSLAQASPGGGASTRSDGPESERQSEGAMLADKEHRPRAENPIEEFRAELVALRAELGDLRRDIESLRHSLGE